MEILAGETPFTWFSLRESLTQQTIDVFMLKVPRCGGITEVARFSSLGSAFHVDIAPHGVGFGISLCAAPQFCMATSNLRPYKYNHLPDPLRGRILATPPEDSARRSRKSRGRQHDRPLLTDFNSRGTRC
ncbi:enolase C-terminal domain-like protein (plasmid) [Streptosporangium sp. CA-135522]|uniref:enolase C-terminal domain-like protein n=1 Tax=Streptosporangium sp. CA-135522 TaxID=3240072 RepID=UPI003D910C7B